MTAYMLTVFQGLRKKWIYAHKFRRRQKFYAKSLSFFVMLWRLFTTHVFCEHLCFGDMSCLKKNFFFEKKRKIVIIG
jgi:hypothetical protein